MANDLDWQVRLRAFAFLDDLQLKHGDLLPRNELQEGFRFRGDPVPLVGPPGIFKPAILPDMPLSVTTKPVADGEARPYEDEFTRNGVLYRYRGTDPDHWNNAGLRRTMTEQVPIIYFFGIVRGRYLAAYPTYVIGDYPGALTFTLAMDEHIIDPGEEPFVEDPEPRRAYATRLVRQRLHQVSFRQRVLQAYREMCAVCRLRHAELLDAAHILPDTDPRAEPVVPNGLALCRLHHAAFDRNVMGIRPDLEIEIRRDVLEETDGPMLIHGLQGFQGAKLIVPGRAELKPNREFLEERYERFRDAG